MEIKLYNYVRLIKTLHSGIDFHSAEGKDFTKNSEGIVLEILKDGWYMVEFDNSMYENPVISVNGKDLEVIQK